MLRKIIRLTIIFEIYLVFFSGAQSSFAGAGNEGLHIKTTPFRANKGQTVIIEIEFNGENSRHNDSLQAIVLEPSKGVRRLELKKMSDRPVTYRSTIKISPQGQSGLYLVQAWLGEDRRPLAVGKAAFLSGPIVADFFIASNADTDDPEGEISNYLQSFQQVGGNFIIAHNLINTQQSYFPSKICKNSRSPDRADIIELLLRHCDQKGLPVLLSVSWDMTAATPSYQRMGEIKAIMKELYQNYGTHPSFAGFYSYQEGSGTYFAPFVREFCSYAKSLNPGLLTACAPYVDDPLLAGYLSVIKPLDIIIYQGMVMASYRPDNRQKYPLCRVKDFCSVGIGAKWLQDKIALTHVEFFGYLENRLSPENSTTNYDNIFSQILSAATAGGSDGISFFTYSSHIYNRLKKFPEIMHSRKAVLDGMQAFQTIWEKISYKPNPITLYFPYSDWVIERWHNYFLPALDAFRMLAIPVDFLPFAPPADEDYPYYPFHKNPQRFARLQENRPVLVLPNVSGFQLTDGDLIKNTIESGGVLIAFGPQIPMAKGYERQKLFGIREIGEKTQKNIRVIESIGERIKKGFQASFPPTQLAGWQSNGARVVAVYDDNTPAIMINRYGRGVAIAVTLDASTAATAFPDLIRDIIDYALAATGKKPTVDILGTNENVNVAVHRTVSGFRLAVVNHNQSALKIKIQPRYISGSATLKWIDLINHNRIAVTAASTGLTVQVPGTGFLAIEAQNQ